MKTAVEWLQDCLTEQYPNGSFVWNTKADLEALFNQAKKMENQQCYSVEEVAIAFNEGQAHSVTGKLVDGKKWVKTHKKEWFNEFKKK